MSTNPLEDDPGREHRIRERAYHLWKADGEPQGRDAEYWERARELVGMVDSAGAGQMSPTAGAAHRLNGQIVDEAALEENLGEFPGRQTDQGDRKMTPSRKIAQPAAKPVLVKKAAAPPAKPVAAAKKTAKPASKPEAPAKPPAKAMAKPASPAKQAAAPAVKAATAVRKPPVVVAPEPEPVKRKAKSKTA